MKRWLFLSVFFPILLFVNQFFVIVHAKNPYPVVGSCGGLPQVLLKTIKDACVEVVASGLKAPRGILPISDNELWVTEMGSWEHNRGRLSRLKWNGSGYLRTTLIEQLDRPHGISLGPDGWVYVAVVDKIIRLNPRAADVAQSAQIVVRDLPSSGLHPLKQIAFNGTMLYINVGAMTDHCERSQASSEAVTYPCKETQNPHPSAAIWRTEIRDGKAGRIEVYARGLRNSMGMAFTKTGLLVQTENSRDYINRSDKKLRDESLPHDEINLVKQDQDYGWPYCYDNNRVSPEYRRYKYACRGKTLPKLLLPAHSAPLGITQYPEDGSIVSLRGMWLVALHGYRDTGYRVVGFSAGFDGFPMGELHNVIFGWGPNQAQPMGAPTEVRVSDTGQVYITDDRNGMVLRLSSM